jgi:o-succinylbenzoate synthase
MKLSLAPLSLRFVRPLRTPRGPLSERHGWVVTLQTPQGDGRGEATPMESFGTEAPERTHAALAGLELPAVPSSLEAIADATRPLAPTPAARFAVECALLELLALRRGVSVAALLLGGPAAPSLPVSALIEGIDAQELARAAVAAVAAGYRTLKMKVAARPLEVDAERLFAVRQAVGKEVKLRIDANAAWTEAGARSALRGLESLDLELCEQPVAAANVEGLRRLKQLSPVRIAADETLCAPTSFERLLEADPTPAADVLVLKPMALGGLLPALELARKAHAVGVGTYVTTMLDGPLARAAAVHLAAALPPSPFAHGLATVELFDGAQSDPLTPRGGSIALPAGPGWGL